jgi:hypothetical protein
MTDSLFLAARPSFLEGASRLVDFGNFLNEYNRSLSPGQADQIALTLDWRQVGADWGRAADLIGRQVHARRSRKK